MLNFDPDIVEPWEAILTLTFFFAVVITAYLADKKLFYKRFFRRKTVRKLTMTSTTVTMTENFNPAFVDDEKLVRQNGVQGRSLQNCFFCS